MALVDELLPALPRPGGKHDSSLVAKAVGPGRIRDAAITTHQQALDSPFSAEGIVRTSLSGARYLHSRERRLVADGVYELFRHQAALDALLGPAAEPAPALARWLAWTVLQGAPLDLVRAAWTAEVPGAVPTFERATDPAASLREPLSKLSPASAVALVGSLHTAIAEALLASLGDQVGRFLAASNDRAKVIIRANRLLTDRAALRRQLADERLQTEPTALAPDGLIVRGPVNLQAIRAHKQGLFELQDEASQLVAEVVDPVGVVVDFCAGAGGKTLAMAALAPRARLLATDVRQVPLEKLKKRAQRAGVRSLKIRGLDPTGPFPSTLEKLRDRADRVLVDAPCSGSGVLRRHPGRRLRLTAEVLESLPRQQDEILQRASTLVAPGGRLIYATCSVLRPENDEVVTRFLEAHPDFAPLPLTEILGERARSLGDGLVMRTTPHEHGTDGFFAAVLVRQG